LALILSCLLYADRDTVIYDVVPSAVLFY